MILSHEKRPVLLIVDDDDEDIYLTRRAFCTTCSDLVFNSVKNDCALFDCLYCKGQFEHLAASSLPDVILLDINMPKTDGLKILQKLRADIRFQYMSVVMFTTSLANSVIQRAYQPGANSFVAKPVSVEGMQQLAEKYLSILVSLKSHSRLTEFLLNTAQLVSHCFVRVTQCKYGHKLRGSM